MNSKLIELLTQHHDLKSDLKSLEYELQEEMKKEFGRYGAVMTPNEARNILWRMHRMERKE